MNRVLSIIGLFCVLLVPAFAVSGQTLPFRLRPYITSGLSSPLHLTNANDGRRRIFIVQQRGIIKVVQPGSTVPTDYLNISTIVSSSGSERGLLGLAFHPQFAANRRFFVYYTRQSDGAIEIAEYLQSETDPNDAVDAAVRVIITIPHSDNSNHNGGTIAFGADGFLYAGIGDGGGANDIPNNAQDINTLLGKFIRLDINTPVGQNPAYNIPPGNPYAGATPGLDEIYAFGMRNPFRFSFDRGGTNQLWAGDVGQNAIEEVDIITAGGNYGWRIMEGTICTPSINGGVCTPPANHIPPVFQYDRRSTPRCSVTGGYVYRGPFRALPFGTYIYGDYCSGELLLWENSQQRLLLDTTRNIASFGEDEDGEIYVVGLGGTVDRVLGNKTSADFDGDLKTDLSVFRPSNSTWYIINSQNSSISVQPFGLNGDIPAAEDFDGDFKADISVFRPSNGTWYTLRSGDQTYSVIQFGQDGDIPAAGDYDGDGKADLAVFRPSNGNWNVLRSKDSSVLTQQWGLTNDIPVAGDYDGDNRYDLAVWRPSNGSWYWINSSNNNLNTIQWGLNGDIPAPGDFDSDGKNDFAVFRPTTAQWHIRKSLNDSLQLTSWGLTGDIPVVGDYDGDGSDDIALFRPSDRVWYIILSANNNIIQSAPWGLMNDLPVPDYDMP